MTNGSIYFHVLEARRRQPVGRDDFSTWLSAQDGNWENYIASIRTIDFTFHSLSEIRRELVESLSNAQTGNLAERKS
jgi:hypothetical protein